MTQHTTGEARPIAGSIVRNWGWLVAVGILLIAMGVLAILAPFLAAIAVNSWIGISFLLAGIGQGLRSTRYAEWGDRAGHLAIALAYAVGGVLVIFNPLASLVAFSVIVAAMLLVAGVVRLRDGLRMRPDPGWGWMTAAGVAALLAALAIYIAFPGSTVWLLGLIAGAAFIIEGAALVKLGMAARRVALARRRRAAAPAEL